MTKCHPNDYEEVLVFLNPAGQKHLVAAYIYKELALTGFMI